MERRKLRTEFQVHKNIRSLFLISLLCLTLPSFAYAKGNGNHKGNNEDSKSSGKNQEDGNKKCEGWGTPNWFAKVENGEIVEFYQKSLVNSICSRKHTFKGSFIDLTIIDSPKDIVDFLSRTYEFAFRFKKTGKYTVKYDLKLQDKNGNNFTGHFIMYTEVVSDRW